VNLTLGSKGNQVKQVQAQLIKLGYNCGTVDGVYGPSTYSAVKAFQQRNHLTVDGVVGPQTWSKLFSNSAVKASPHDTSGSSGSGSGNSSTSAFALYTTDGQGHLTSTSYSTQAAAEQAYQKLNQTAATRHTEGGYVVNLKSKAIVDLPTRYYYELQGQWYVHLNGRDLWQASQVPPFAKAGVLYYATDTTDSPHFTDYYILSDHKNASGQWVYSGAHAGKWENKYRTVDLRSIAPVTPSQIDSWLLQRDDALQGLGASMVDAQKGYGVNAIYLMAHALEETGGGQSDIALAKNNIYGYGAYDSNPGNLAGTFPSEDYAVHYQAYTVRMSYLETGSASGLGVYSHYYNAPSLDGMNENYATDHDWSESIAAIVDDFTGDEHVQFATSQSVPSISSICEQGEPFYLTNGAQGTWVVTKFPGTLQVGKSGSEVRVLQALLAIKGYDQYLGSGSKGTDGDFGNLTKTALAHYQQDYNNKHPNALRTDGVCDEPTWNSLISGQSTVSVTAIRIGYANGQVTDEFKVNGHWIDGRALHLTNVYRVVPKGVNPKSSQYVKLANVGGGLHAGDWVVASGPTAKTVRYSVQQYDAAHKENTVILKTTSISSQYELVPYDLPVSQWQTWKPSSK
jgi:peptidoglycan hydrolase-like protein with peptidoglycan-binding domain/beta-N-acetylglucosaminidase